MQDVVLVQRCPSPYIITRTPCSACSGLGDTVLPVLLMYTTAEVLSIFSRTWMLLLSLKKHLKARNAARSSRQLMWSSFSFLDQGPPILTPWHTVPHPILEASVSRVTFGFLAMTLHPFQFVKWVVHHCSSSLTSSDRRRVL